VRPQVALLYANNTQCADKVFAYVCDMLANDRYVARVLESRPAVLSWKALLAVLAVHPAFADAQKYYYVRDCMVRFLGTSPPPPATVLPSWTTPTPTSTAAATGTTVPSTPVPAAPPHAPAINTPAATTTAAHGAAAAVDPPASGDGANATTTAPAMSTGPPGLAPAYHRSSPVDSSPGVHVRPPSPAAHTVYGEIDAGLARPPPLKSQSQELVLRYAAAAAAASATGVGPGEAADFEPPVRGRHQRERSNSFGATAADSTALSAAAFAYAGGPGRLAGSAAYAGGAGGGAWGYGGGGVGGGSSSSGGGGGVGGGGSSSSGSSGGGGRGGSPQRTVGHGVRPSMSVPSLPLMASGGGGGGLQGHSHMHAYGHGHAHGGFRAHDAAAAAAAAAAAGVALHGSTSGNLGEGTLGRAGARMPSVGLIILAGVGLGGPLSQTPVAIWLRSLRLHKYTEQLQHLDFAFLLWVAHPLGSKALLVCCSDRGWVWR
jgi:hypothetical protein